MFWTPLGFIRVMALGSLDPWESTLHLGDTTVLLAQKASAGCQ
jgi:hypothetical protein